MSFEVSWGLIFTCIRLRVRHQTTGVANMEFRISMETSYFSVFNSNMGRGPDNRTKSVRHTRERAAESRLSPPSLAPPACLFMLSPTHGWVTSIPTPSPLQGEDSPWAEGVSFASSGRRGAMGPGHACPQLPAFASLGTEV